MSKMNKLSSIKKQIIDLFKKQKINFYLKQLICNIQRVEFSQDIKSQINIPPFNNSAVDGYALLKKDLNLKTLFVKEELLLVIIKMLLSLVRQ